MNPVPRFFLFGLKSARQKLPFTTSKKNLSY
jgi:hypothetical protein